MTPSTDNPELQPKIRIVITRQTVAQKRHVRPGEELLVPEKEAALLIGLRKAELAPASSN